MRAGKLERTRGGPAHGDAGMESKPGKNNQRGGAGRAKVLEKSGDPAPTMLIIFRAVEIGVQRSMR
jgi:hypothetical protein